jgi:hypothetical protein
MLLVDPLDGFTWLDAPKSVCVWGIDDQRLSGDES